MPIRHPALRTALFVHREALDRSLIQQDEVASVCDLIPAMYGTRQQTAAYDENKRVEAKSVALAKGASMASNRAPPAQANNRRALGDIGNLVGALSARCTVSKDGLQESVGHTLRIPAAAVKQVVVGDRPITRRFGANVASNQLPPKPAAVQPLPPQPLEEPEPEPIVENALSWGAKQRRTMGPSKSREFTEKATEASLAPSRSIDNENRGMASLTNLTSHIPAAHPARFKDLTKCDARGGIRKKQTLTATLTARSEAACGGFEVEMEEAEEPLPNIDGGDVGNQLAVVDYVEDIYDFYRKTEIQSCVAPDYMSRQADINEKMRAILIDWLIEVHLKFKLMPETLFLTTNLIDRYLACQSVLRKNLQLVGVTAMLLASKYEEIWAPEVQDFVFISDNAYTREQVLEMEKSMLNKLKFNLTVPTPYVFLVRFLKAAASDLQMDMLSFYLVELCLMEYVMVKYPPSLLAATAVYTAQQTLRKNPSWTTTLQRHTGYAEMQLRDCATMMVGYHRKAGEGNVKNVVHKKYSSPKFNSVAALQPATLVLEDDSSNISS